MRSQPTSLGFRGVCLLQAGFFDFVALPLVRTWVAICPQAQPALEAIELNRTRWVELADTTDRRTSDRTSSDHAAPAPSPAPSPSSPRRDNPLARVGRAGSGTVRFEGD